MFAKKDSRGTFGLLPWEGEKALSDTIMLANTAVLDIWDGESLRHGGDQDWYAELWQRQAGCGPTNCSNLMRYLAQTRPGCGALCPYDAAQKPGFIQLMEDLWRYVTPGNMGVNTTAIFVEGAARYGRERGVPLATKALDVPAIHCSRRLYPQVAAFVSQALERALPVAFLNLSNGVLQNLDNWHWVTLVALKGDDALAYDQGEAKWVDLAQWLATSMMGGGFVTVEPSG